AVREQVGRDAAAAAEDLRVAETKVSDLSAEITMAKQTVDGFDAAMKEWSAAREAAVAERAEAVADIEALQLAEEIEPKLEEYERRIANGRDLLRIRAEYDHAVKMYDESVGRRERVEHDLDLCDSIASQLGKDGMCRQDAVGASAGVLVPDADLLRRWGMVVALDGAGDVSINSRPFWLASTSEQWRAAAAIAAGIARLTTRWVILDGADILDVAGRSVLSDWAISRPPGLLSVVIGAVSPPISEAKVRALRAVHVRVCWAEDGQVRVLGEDDNGKPEAENEADATQAVEAAT
ncbi:MAG: hypothetical protein ACE5E5_16810, partial [Phycisphaerae bacterium]